LILDFNYSVIVKKLILFVFTIFLLGCDNFIEAPSSQSKSIGSKSQIKKEGSSEDYPDNKYCANINYYNPNTGRHSTYRLTVDVADNKVIQLDFPNGGVLDEDHFNAPVLNEEGEASFTNDKGYEYEVLILGQTDNCFDGVPMAEQCEGTTRRGLRCKHLTDNANKLCWQHQNQER